MHSCTVNWINVGNYIAQAAPDVPFVLSQDGAVVCPPGLASGINMAMKRCSRLWQQAWVEEWVAGTILNNPVHWLVVQLHVQLQGGSRTPRIENRGSRTCRRCICSVCCMCYPLGAGSARTHSVCCHMYIPTLRHIRGARK